MSGFKKLVYIQFYPDAWLQSPELRRLKPEVKGFYIDLICQLFYCFPYGHCSLLNYKKANKLQKQVNQRVNQVVIHEDNDEDNLWADLTLNFSLHKQLSVVDNLEKELHKYLPYSPDEISSYIRILEENRVISRNAQGIIYVRRMVKDFKRKLVAYLNGSKGGNPKFKKRKTTPKSTETKQRKSLKTNELENLDNQGVEPLRSYSLPIDNKGVGKGEYREGKTNPNGEKNATIHPRGVFPLQNLYERSWSDLSSPSCNQFPSAMIRGLTEQGFLKWKEFVDWVERNEYQELWVARPFGPKDFQHVYFEKNFKETHWKPVIEKILSTGIEPKHTLFYRIPEFLRHVLARNSSTAPARTNMDTGNSDFEQQKTW